MDSCCEVGQVKVASALKLLPTLSSLKFKNCFNDLKYFNIPEHIFKALKLRGRPIRNFKMVGSFIGEGNLFNMIGLANRGYISEQLVLDVAGIDPDRAPKKQNTGLFSGLMSKKADPKLSQSF